MIFSSRARSLVLAATVAGLAVIYLPLLVVLINAFNPSKVFGWPPRGLTLQWWSRAAANEGVRAPRPAPGLGAGNHGRPRTRGSGPGRSTAGGAADALPGIVTGR
ncbi:MAG: hypothetical protein IPK24_17735 [Kineosporiaceae bacterium]|nr:hypothetical protein [Kineosporiaceae bacterium]